MSPVKWDGMPEVLDKHGHYPLCDRPTGADMRKLGLTRYNSPRLTCPSVDGMHIRATMTGQFRPPRKGEWYLSGSKIEAYRAPNDLSSPYHIAKLLVMYRKTTITWCPNV